MRQPLTVLVTAGVALLPAFAGADGAPSDPARWTFPLPVTPVVGSPLAIHNPLMVVITVLSVVVCAIILYSMIRHRKCRDEAPTRFGGPRGLVQWLWVLVPFAILLFIDVVLMGVPAANTVSGVEGPRPRADMVATGRMRHTATDIMHRGHPPPPVE